MPRRIRLLRLRLTYADGMVLHTTSSGAVPALDELRLVAEQDGAIAALGASRVNIAYLSGLSAEALVASCLAVARGLDWAQPWAGLAAAVDATHPALPAPARMLFETAAADGAARAAGQSLAAYLGGAVAAWLPSNQTLFRADDETLLRRAETYVARGFRDLKLRIGFGAFADDLRRLCLLRHRLGPEPRLSVDANGSWDAADASRRLVALAPLGLHYVEQPLPADAWVATAMLSRTSAIRIMLDESLTDLAAVNRLIATRAAPLAHLKLAKLGGLDRLLAAGRWLAAAGIGVMVGQMNEGVVSTLAAAHAAAALGASLTELYGADGLAADPAGALRYTDGGVHLLPGPGLGLTRHADGGAVLWEHTV